MTYQCQIEFEFSRTKMLLCQAFHLTDAVVDFFVMLVYEGLVMEGKTAYNGLVVSQLGEFPPVFLIIPSKRIQ